MIIGANAVTNVNPGSMVLNQLERQTICAALRNGLGLTHACRGLHKHPRDVSEFIKATPQFFLECQQHAIAGYQSILVEMNNSQNKKAWDRWRTNRSYIDNFITTVTLWESFGTPKDWEFNKITLAVKHCKTIPETATAMGFEESHFFSKLYTDSKLVHWLVQNHFDI